MYYSVLCYSLGLQYLIFKISSCFQFYLFKSLYTQHTLHNITTNTHQEHNQEHNTTYTKNTIQHTLQNYLTQHYHYYLSIITIYTIQHTPRTQYNIHTHTPLSLLLITNYNIHTTLYILIYAI